MSEDGVGLDGAWNRGGEDHAGHAATDELLGRSLEFLDLLVRVHRGSCFAFASVRAASDEPVAHEATLLLQAELRDAKQKLCGCLLLQ